MKLTTNKSKNDKIIIKIDEYEQCEADGTYTTITPKLIQYIEKICRSSMEYKAFIENLKNNLDIKRCTYYKGYSIENGFTIEFHHHPFTLYDLVETVCTRMKCNDEDGKISDMMVAKEVMMLHYMFMVGLVPLNPTAHEAIHAGLFICHTDLVIGNWRLFYEEYKEYMSERLLDKIEEMLAKEKDLKADEIPEIFNKKETVLINDRLLLNKDFDFTQMLDSRVMKNIGENNGK